MRPLVLLPLVILALDTTSIEAQRRRRDRTPSDVHTIQVGGRERSWVLRAPRDLTRPLPLVIVLHGGGGNAANAEAMTGFTRLVQSEQLLVAYPNGTGRRGDALLTWNAGHCCGYAMENRVDDVAFIDAMIDAIALATPVDVNRIYITGMSNGAMMTHRLAASMRHRPAAIAPVVGAVFGDEPPPRSPVSALIFNGLKDTSVPTDGGHGNGLGRRAWDDTPPRANEAQGDYWRAAAGCEATPRTTERDRLIHWMWVCPPGVAVELYQVTDGGHAWPGGRAGTRRADAPSSAINATAAMWEFFKSHPRR